MAASFVQKQTIKWPPEIFIWQKRLRVEYPKQSQRMISKSFVMWPLSLNDSSSQILNDLAIWNLELISYTDTSALLLQYFALVKVPSMPLSVAQAIATLAFCQLSSIQARCWSSSEIRRVFKTTRMLYFILELIKYHPVVMIIPTSSFQKRWFSQFLYHRTRKKWKKLPESTGFKNWRFYLSRKVMRCSDRYSNRQLILTKL